MRNVDDAVEDIVEDRRRIRNKNKIEKNLKEDKKRKNKTNVQNRDRSRRRRARNIQNQIEPRNGRRNKNLRNYFTSGRNGVVNSNVSNTDNANNISLSRSGSIVINNNGTINISNDGSIVQPLLQNENDIINPIPDNQPDIVNPIHNNDDIVNPIPDNDSSDDNLVQEEEIKFWTKIQKRVAKAFDTIRDAFKNFDESIDDGIEELGKMTNMLEERGKMTNMFEDFKNIYAVQKIADSTKDIIGDTISKTMDMSREGAIRNNKPLSEVIKENTERLGKLGKGIVGTAEEQQIIQTNFSEHGFKNQKWLDEYETINITNDEDRKKVIKQFGADRLDEQGNLVLSRNEIFHDLLDKKLVEADDLYRYREFLEKGMSVNDMYKILNTRAAYRGQEYYVETDIDKYTDALDSSVTAMAKAKYGSDDKGRAKFKAKAMEEYAKVANTAGATWVGQDLMERELKLLMSEDKDDRIAAQKKYGEDYAHLRTLVSEGELNQAARGIVERFAYASELTGTTGGENALEQMGFDVEELKGFTYTGEEMRNALNDLAKVDKELQGKTVFSLNKIHHTVEEILQSIISTNPYTFKVLSTLDSIGLDIADLPGLYFGGKMIGGMLKGGAKLIKDALSGVFGGGTSGGDVSSSTGGIGSKLMNWLTGGGVAQVGIGGVAKSLITKVAAPLSIIQTMYQGFKGYQEAEELGAGKVNSTISHMIGGDSSGVSGAVGNAMKWGATGALIGSVVPVIGTAVGGAVGTLAGAITGYFGGDEITKTLSKIPNAIRGAIDGFNSYLDDLDAKIAKKRGEIYNYIKERIEITKQDILGKWDTIKTYILEKIEILKQIPSQIVDWFTDASQNIYSNMTNYVSQKYSEIVESFSKGYYTVSSYITQKYTDIYNSVTGKIGEVKDSVTNFIQSIIDGMKDMYKSVTEKFSVSYWKDKIFGGDEKETEERERTKGLFGNVMDFFGFGRGASKSNVVSHILKSEGGYVNDPNDRGGETKYGITKAKARELGYTGDMRNMPKNIAETYYSGLYDKIQNKYGFDEKATAMVTDLAVNSGEGRIKDMLAYSGGDYNKMLEWRRNYYNRIVEKDPTQQKFLKGWQNRLTKLDKEINNGNGAEFNDIQPVSDKLMTLDTSKVVELKNGNLAESQNGNVELMSMLGGILGNNNEGGDNTDVVNAIGDTNSLLKLLVVALTRSPKNNGLLGY